MKKFALIITALLIGCMLMTECKKKESPANDNGGGGGSDPEPTPTTMVKYIIDTIGEHYPTADCFKYTITYFVGENDSVVLNNVSLPWASEAFEVTQKPFMATLKGVVSFNDEDIPDGAFSFSYRPAIVINGYSSSSGKHHNFESREAFFNYYNAHPTSLNIKIQHNVY